MTRYFAGCRTAEDLKKEYRKLVKELHPDNQNGSEESFKAMQTEYESAWSRLKDIHTAPDGTQYRASEETTETAAEYMEIIEALRKISGIEIELCGSWIWISGNTYPARDELKAAGCRFASKKRMWYWRPEEEATTSRKGGQTIEKIRAKYGSQIIQMAPQARLA